MGRSQRRRRGIKASREAIERELDAVLAQLFLQDTSTPGANIDPTETGWTQIRR